MKTYGRLEKDGNEALPDVFFVEHEDADLEDYQAKWEIAMNLLHSLGYDVVYETVEDDAPGSYEGEFSSEEELRLHIQGRNPVATFTKLEV